jgi:integrase
MKRSTITKRGVDALKRGASISDDTVRGFIARRLPSNAVTFGYRYVERTTGKRRWLPLGLYGRVTVEQARRLAQKAAGEVASGDDPLQQRLDERTAAKSAPATVVDDILDRFLRDYVDKKNLRTKDEVRRAIDNWVRPVIGKRPIAEVSRKDIIEMCDGIAAKVSLRRADTILAYVRKAFNWWSIQGDAEFKSPIVSGMSRVKTKELVRQRFLTPSELRDVWAALECVHPAYSAIVRALLFSAVRRDEMADLRFSEIDGDVIVIPGERMKGGMPHAVPLTPELRRIIESRGKPKNAAYVFWARKGGSRPFQGWSRQKRLLDKHINRIRAARGDPEMRDWRLHDLRRTARTWMSRAGVDTDIAERILAHAKESVRAVYDVYEYLDEKRDGLLRLEAYILEVLSNRAN